MTQERNASPIRLLPSPEPIEQAVRAFSQRLEAQGRSPNTISAYQRDLLTLARVLIERHPGLSLTQITPGMLDEALTSPAVARTSGGEPRSPASMHRFKAALRSFFAWAKDTDLVVENPARLVKLRRLPRTPPVFLTEAEKKRLLKELRGQASTMATRDRLIIELFLGTGIRLQELVDLDLEDVDLDAKHLRVRHAKGNVPQLKFLKTDLRSLLRSYLAERRRQGTGECSALFLSNREVRLSPRQVARRLEHWLEAAGIAKHIGPHALRHTFATHLYSRTGDILVVQRALGHRDLSTTQVYTHLIDGVLEEALERL